MSIAPALGAALLGLALISVAPVSAQETVTVAVGDAWFCSSDYQGGVCETSIDAGDTVVWDFSGALIPHTTTECGSSCDAPSDAPLWTSGTVSDGRTYSYTFSQPGTYLYYCQIHPDIQRGRIIVREAQLEPTAQAPSTTPVATAPAGNSLPPTGTGPGDNSPNAGWWLFVATGLTIGGGGLLYAGARLRRQK